MRIEVRGGENSIRIPLPTGLVFSSATAWIGGLAVKKYAPEVWASMPPDTLRALFAELRRVKKKYGKWELVEVCSSDGSYVHIVL